MLLSNSYYSYNLLVSLRYNTYEYMIQYAEHYSYLYLWCKNVWLNKKTQFYSGRLTEKYDF